jgi:hypothetical protein
MKPCLFYFTILVVYFGAFDAASAKILLLSP